jgi:glutamate/tyrosine decarboxylase-like PLP-dependent enzyme
MRGMIRAAGLTFRGGATMEIAHRADAVTGALVDKVVEHTHEYISSLRNGSVQPTSSAEELRALLSVPLPPDPQEPLAVVRALIRDAGPGLMLMPSGRFFGFVIGGTLPVALAADWLTSAWDQNAGLFTAAPAACVVEEVVGGWLKDILGLPAQASFALVTGGQMANFTCLAAARHHVLARTGWNVEERGLTGAPRVRVVAGVKRHASIDRALRYLGLGTDCVEAVDVDDQGRMLPASLQRVVGSGDGPTIVCAQAGEVNTGAFDDLPTVCEIAHAMNAWVHVDGAFGLWAAASARYRHLASGAELADSWATDCHKWLNVPYDCGFAVCAHPASHRGAMSVQAEYLIQSDDSGPRDPVDWNPEFSRRARGFTVYAALRTLGRSGVAELVDHLCARATQFAQRLQSISGAQVLNDVVLNQVLVRFTRAGNDAAADDDLTRSVISRVQRSGTCWMSGTTWLGRAAMRISVSSWRTTEDDVDRSVAAILQATQIA